MILLIAVLVVGLFQLVLVLKNKNKEKIRKKHSLPVLILSICMIFVWLQPYGVLAKKQGFDNYRADEFVTDYEALRQAHNNLRGSFSIQDNIYFVQRLSESEYGLLKIGIDGNTEIMDRAAYIPERNLGVQGTKLFYLKYDYDWSGYNDRFPDRSEQNAKFDIGVFNTSTGELSEYRFEDLPSEVQNSVYCSMLIGIRDNNLFFFARTAEEHDHIEVYSIPVSDGQLDMSRTEKYAWNLKAVGLMHSDTEYEKLYNGFICKHFDFDLISFSAAGVGNLRFEHTTGVAEPLKVIRNDEYETYINYVVDYNFYDDTLYYVQFDWDNKTYSILSTDGVDSYNVIADQIRLSDHVDHLNFRVLVNDSFVVLTDGTETETFQR